MKFNNKMKCCVPLCEQRSEKLVSESNSETEEVSFHEIPTTQSIRHSWLESIGVNESHLPEDAVVCSQHFQKDDFYTECGSNKLRNDSIPSAFRFTNSSAVQVCMICLDTAAKLCPFNEYLTNAYSNVIGLSKSLREINNAPKLCTECAQRLSNCYKFKGKALSAHNLLLQLYKEHGMLTIENIKTINRVEYQLTSNIVKHAIKPDHCDLYFNDLDEDKNVLDETICNTVQYAEVKVESNDDIVSDAKVKDEVFDFDIDNEADSDDVQVKNNDLRRTDVKCLDDNDLDHDMDSLNDYDGCVKYLNENSKVEDTKRKLNIVTVIRKNSESTPNKDVFANKNSINLRKVKLINDAAPKIKNSRKKVSPVKDRSKTTKSNKKLCSKDKVSVGVKKNKLKLVKSNKKVPDDVKNGIKHRKKVAESDIVRISNDAKNKDLVKPKTQDCGDLKLFTVTVLTYVEQLAEVQRRKDTDGYIRSPYKCNICYKGYWYTVPYSRHMEKHTDKYGQLECDICGFHMKTRTHLRKHIKSYHDVRFSCKSCIFVSNDRSQALAHEQWHNGKKYRCPHCEVEFAKRSSYLSHLRIKHPSDCVCALCGFSFVSEKGLQCHMNMTHRFDEVQNPSGPLCEECDIRFASVTAYEQHMKVSPKHAPANTLKRNEPQHRLSDPNRNTKKDGDGEGGGAILCELCGKSFRWPAQLLQHSQVHTGEKLFRCSVCGKRFMHKLTLALHTRSHAEHPVRYDCGVCGKSFTHYSNRHRHMLSHREARPYYKCDICDKNFTTAQGRNAHVSHVHSNVPRPKRVRSSRPRAPGTGNVGQVAETSDSQDS